MSAWSLVQVILTLLGLVGVGFALRASGLLARDDAQVINKIIIYVGLPAMIFQAVHPAELTWDLAGVAGVAWVAAVGTLLAAWALGRLTRLSAGVLGGFILVSALGNTGYLGYPVAQSVLGEEGLVRAIFFDVFGTVLVLLLVGLPIAQHYGANDEETPNPVREVLAFPAVIALLAALLLRPVGLPAVVSDGLEALRRLVVPLIMISVGLSLRLASVREHAKEISLVAGLKLVAAPLVALGVATAIGWDSELVRLVVLQAGMPSMMLTLVIGMRFGLDTDFIASAILVTTVGAALTVPAFQLMLG